MDKNKNNQFEKMKKFGKISILEEEETLQKKKKCCWNLSKNSY